MSQTLRICGASQLQHKPIQSSSEITEDRSIGRHAVYDDPDLADMDLVPPQVRPSAITILHSQASPREPLTSSLLAWLCNIGHPMSHPRAVLVNGNPFPPKFQREGRSPAPSTPVRVAGEVSFSRCVEPLQLQGLLLAKRG